MKRNVHRAGLLVLLLCGMLFGTVTAYASAKSTYDKAVNYYKNGQFESAQENFKKLPAKANEACVKRMSAAMKKAYSQVVKKNDTIREGRFGPERRMYGYYLTDIDKDGLPELLVETGDYEYGKEASVYIFQDGKAKCVGSFGSASRTFCYDPRGNGMTVVYARQGQEQIYSIRLVNGVLQETEVWNSRSYTSSYGDTSVPYHLYNYVAKQWNYNYNAAQGEIDLSPFTVQDAEKEAAIKLNKSSASVKVGATLQLKATVTGDSGKVTWSSSDRTIATVSSKGKVTGKKAGTVTITAKANGKTATCKVKVKRIKATIKLDKSSAAIKIGASVKLKATVTGDSSKVTWFSSDKTIATVSSKGKVTGKSAGTVTITAKANGKTATCKVKVKRNKATIKLNKSSATIRVGTSVRLKATVTGDSDKVTWSSSDAAIATVSSKGKVIGKSAGTVTITARVNGKKARCTVTVSEEE